MKASSRLVELSNLLGNTYFAVSIAKSAKTTIKLTMKIQQIQKPNKKSGKRKDGTFTALRDRGCLRGESKDERNPRCSGGHGWTLRLPPDSSVHARRSEAGVSNWASLDRVYEGQFLRR